MKSRFSGFMRIPYKNIVLRKEIKRILVWFPCAEQGFAWNWPVSVVGSLRNAPWGLSIEFWMAKNPLQIRLTSEDLFNELAFV